MSKRWVVNASPLIVLGKIGRLALLQTLTDGLVISYAVVQEIIAGNESDDSRKWVLQEGVKHTQTFEQLDPIIASWDLGTGESAVLSFARQHSDFEAVIDDRAARNCAKALQIPVRGTLGIVLLAKQAQLIPKTKVVIEELRNAGLRMDATTIQAILELSGE